jgi:hypothetical protein
MVRTVGIVIPIRTTAIGMRTVLPIPMKAVRTIAEATIVPAMTAVRPAMAMRDVTIIGRIGTALIGAVVPITGMTDVRVGETFTSLRMTETRITNHDEGRDECR